MEPVNVAEFSVVDYIVFISLLVGSLGIGAYFGIKGNKTTDDFLLAGRDMNCIPVALSMIATLISSISLLGIIGEVYGNGITLMWSVFGIGIGMAIATTIFLPVIYPLRLRSINEYLKLRFESEWLAKAVLLISTISSCMYLGLCLYAPTLALESVTPYSSGTYIIILGTVVTLYSSYGGMKAVVWTDAVQSIIMILGVLVSTISALVHAGGFGAVFEISEKHQRTDAIKGGFGLHERHTIFNVIMMSTVNFASFFSFAQPTVQRIGTMKSFKQVQRLMFMNCIGLILMFSCLYFVGLCIFATYAECDPLTMDFIHRKDQIFPYFVMDKMGFVVGVPGLFVACLFSGTMSSISSVLNSVPTMLWADFLSDLPIFERSSERTKTMTNKIITVFLGLFMIGMAFLSSKLGGLIQATFTIMSIMSGPSLGVFFLGFCVPFCNKKGAAVGIFSALVCMTWLGIGVQFYGTKPELLPLSIEGCANSTLAAVAEVSNKIKLGDGGTFILEQVTKSPEPPHHLAAVYDISYTYLSTMGSSLCVIVGIIVSLATGKTDLGDVDPRYVLPIFKNMVGGNLPKQEEEKKLNPSQIEDITVTTDKTDNKS